MRAGKLRVLHFIPILMDCVIFNKKAEHRTFVNKIQTVEKIIIVDLNLKTCEGVP